MADELTIEGKLYISSKRAAQLSQYTQDYVGQLCRGGYIDAQRIGGLWYVFMDSLTKYKEKAEAYVPQPPQQPTYKNQPNDTLISFDGKDYISASRAAEVTGYHQDYVGQLARENKILSRQVGNRWYVQREDLLKHKEEKDRLLAAVQVQAVGIPEARVQIKEKSPDFNEPLLTYSRDDGMLMPNTNKHPSEAGLHWRETQDDQSVTAEAGYPVEEARSVQAEMQPNVVPIRIDQRFRYGQNSDVESSKKSHANSRYQASNTVRQPRKTMNIATILIATSVLLLVVYAGIFLTGSGAPNNANGDGSKAEGNIRAVIAQIGDVLEKLITTELVYKRSVR